MTALADATVAQTAAALSKHGLCIRGIVRTSANLHADYPFGDTKSIVLVGHLGISFWPHFETWLNEQPQLDDPLDAWSKQVLNAIGATLNARTCLPSDGPPFMPFQRLALQAEPLSVSPLKLLMHPEAGLWHAYRGALLFNVDFTDGENSATRIDEAMPVAPTPCEQCASRVCLDTCPVAAFDGEHYDTDRCFEHLQTNAGRECVAKGCRARGACPVGIAYQYDDAQMQFHMRAFIQSRIGARAV